MTDKPSTVEEEYFARENAEKLRKLAAEQTTKLAHAEREALKKLHYMRCPNCGMELHKVTFKDVVIDRCFSCNGSFLQKNELEKLSGGGGEVMQAVLNLFATHKKG